MSVGRPLQSRGVFYVPNGLPKRKSYELLCLEEGERQKAKTGTDIQCSNYDLLTKNIVFSLHIILYLK